MDAPTTKTFTDIIAIGSDFKFDCQRMRETIQATLDRFHKYIWIPTYHYAEPPEEGWSLENPEPEPTVTWAWHQNAGVLYSPAELLIIKEYYDYFVSMKLYFDTFTTTNAAVVATMFNPTPKIDALFAQTLSGVIAG